MVKKSLWSAVPIALSIGSIAHAQSAAPPGTQTSAPVSADTSGEGLEEIIVTASRRSESIRETPVAVSSYAGDKLEAAHVLSLTDLIPSSPNIQLGSITTNEDITIRGIGNDLTQAGSDPGVAFHQDGVYLAETGLATSAFLDVNRLEVARGPQGTLFGRNATGGAVNLITNAPITELSYGIDSNLGFDPTEDHVAGFVSGPLTSDGTLLGRLAAQQTYNEGFTKNLSPNGPSRLDGTNNYSARAQLMWAPSTDFNARLSLEYQGEHDAGPGYYLMGSANPATILPPAFQLGADNLNQRQTYEGVGVNRLRSLGAALFTDWSIGGGDFKGTFAYNKSQGYSDSADGEPLNFFPNATAQNTTQNFSELIYASDSQNPFSFVVGANAFHEKEDQNLAATLVPLQLVVNVGGTVITDSYAGFAHGQYAFDFGWKVFAGLRVTDDEKHIDEFNNFIGTLTQHHSWTQPTYEVGTSYDFTQSVTGYIKYATGYKSGGYSAGALAPPFNPEKDRLVEAGLKGSYFDRALEANLAVFHTGYDDLQVNQVIGVISQVTNAAKATSNGVELETVERITPSLRFEFSVGYLDAYFNEFDTEDAARPELGVLDLAGNRLPFAPRFTVNGAAYYDIPIGAPGKLTAGAQYDWKSTTYFSEFNLPITSQASVGKLNLTLNYQEPNQRWSVGVYARNVTNATVKNEVLTISALADSLALARLDPGREVGLSFHYKY